MRVNKTSIPFFLSLLTLAACGGGGGGGGGGVLTPSASLSTLTADRTTAPADGVTEVLLTAIVRDTVGGTLDGREVRFDVLGTGAVLSATSVIASNGGIAVSKLTSTVAGPVTVSATVTPDAEAVRLDTTLTITFITTTAPVVAGPARYQDVDFDATASAGDKLVVPFSTDVVVTGAIASDFLLPVQGDSHGVGANVTAGPASNEVTITLGSQPKLRTRGRFQNGLVVNNEPSGIDVQNGQSIRSAIDGTPANASTPADIGPLPVAATTVATGGQLIAVGDANGDGVVDVVVADSSVLRAFVNNAGALTAAGTFASQPARDLTVSNLNRIGAAEALTAESGGVQVWNNPAAGGNAPAFSQAQLVATGDTNAVAAADFNADGFPDIIAGTTSGVVVALHQRNLGNSYAIGTTLSFGIATQDVRVVDFDGDGDLDILLAQGSNGVQVVLAENGVLTPGALISVADAQSVAVADIDRDGRLDIVVGGGTVAVVRNSQQGFVSTALSLAASQVELVDFDGDSFADLIARTSSGVEYLLNDRAGNFLPLGSSSVTGLLDLAYADLDRDGDDEILAVDATTVRPFAGSLVGTQGDSTLVATDDLGVDAVGKQVLGDVNGDGLLDRIVATANGAQVWLGDGLGSFNVATSFGGPLPAAIVLGDLDGDLDLDCVLGFNGSNDVYTNDGAGAFTFATSFATNSDTRSLALTDFEQDGDLDVFVGNNGTNQLFINTLSGGAITLTENTIAFQSLLPQALANETIAVLVFDFDREGDEDIILVNGGTITSPQNAYVLRRSGSGYTLLNTLNAQLLATSAVIGDVDGDGRDDLSIAQLSTAGNASIKWFRGFATSISTLPTNVATNGQYFSRSLIVADLDGDGRADFVVGDVSVSNQPIAVLRQQPDGTFQIAQEFPTTRLEQIAAGDFDQDGDVDLVTVETTGPSRVLENR